MVNVSKIRDVVLLPHKYIASSLLEPTHNRVAT